MTNPQFAEEVSSQFTIATREDGTEYTTAPEFSAARRMVRDCHFDLFDGTLPNDWIYSTLADITDAYANGEDDSYALADQLTDMYTNDLLNWCQEPFAMPYLDDAMQPDEGKNLTSFTGIITLAQRECLAVMARWVEDWLNENQSEDEEEAS